MTLRHLFLALAFTLALPAFGGAQDAAEPAPVVDAQGPIPDIRDIREPAPPAPAMPWERTLLLGALVLAGLALGYGLWRGARRTLLAPHRVALGELRALEKHAAELEPEALTDALAAVVRSYVERRFDVHAPRRTTEELFSDLAEHPALRAHGPQLMDLLRRCDRIRFACDDADAAERRSLVTAAESFVRESTKGPATTPTSSTLGALS